MSIQVTDAHQRCTALAECYQACLHPDAGFLPPVTPLDVLPAAFAPLFEAAGELAQRYHGSQATVRGWLDGVFKEASSTPTDAVIEALEPAALDALMTVVSILCHCYRWDSAPPRADSYRIERIALPEGLRSTWSCLARKLDQPRVGNLYNMVLCNWRMRGRAGGSSYENREIDGEALELAHSWLLPPAAHELHAFVMTGIETEARGARAVRTAVALVQASTRASLHEVAYLLDRLCFEIEDMGRPFKVYIQKKRIRPDHFLTLIQPTTIWGLDEGDGPLEGASGPQLGCIQAIDAVLALKRESHMGQAILHSRRYMPARHRRFLTVLDDTAGCVRDFVHAQRDPQMTRLFNACVQAMQSWRRIHVKRGALYLKGETQRADALYVSTGLVVALDADRVKAFETSMAERSQETASAAFSEHDGCTRTPLQAVFHYLTDADRAALLECAVKREFARGQMIIEAGVRRVGIFIVREGTVVVVRMQRGRPVALARLAEGEVFGEMAFLENEDTSAAVIADSPTCIDVIPREDVFRLFASHDGFAARFFQSLATLLSQRLRTVSLSLTDFFVRQEPSVGRKRSRHTGRLRQPVPAELSGELARFGQTLGKVETELQSGCIAVEQAQVEVSAASDGIVLLAQRWNSEPGITDHIFRETIAWLMQSALLEHMRCRPRGHCADFELLSELYTGSVRGDGLLGPLIDYWYRALPTLRALVELESGMLAGLSRAVATRAARTTPTRVLCLGAGWAGTMLRFLQTGQPQTRAIEATFLDADDDTCKHVAARALELGLAPQVLHDNVLTEAQRRGRCSLPPQQVIYADLLVQHADDQELGLLLDWTHRQLEPGGVLLFPLLADDTQDRAFLEIIVDWPLHRRSLDELHELLSESAFGQTPLGVRVESGPLVSYLEVRRA